MTAEIAEIAEIAERQRADAHYTDATHHPVDLDVNPGAWRVRRTGLRLRHALR
ncbi:MAG: hypothetical protein ACP5PB_06940 [Acidimicrobiales bacterium]